MESFEMAEEQILHRKGRHRKKQLFNSIMQQMEFYFSDSNLSKDKFLLPMIERDSYVDISVFLKFNKINKLTTNLDDIVKAINNSQLLELSNDKTKVKRKLPLIFRKEVDDCTIYVERIKADATHEWLSSIFSEFGNVTYVSIPKYKHNKLNKGFAFVEYEKESDAVEALSYFESIGCRMSSLMPPENLCSIATYEPNNADISCSNTKEGCSRKCDVKRKRSLSIEGTEANDNKKIKVAEDVCINDGGGNNNGDNVQNGDFVVDKKRKKQKKMKKKLFKELGLQVLAKSEWKKIRNRYLDNQKVKMKQLKQFLNKRKYGGSHVEINKQKVQRDEHFDKKNKDSVQEGHLQTLPYMPGVIVKVQFIEPLADSKKVKEELRQYSSALQYVDIPQSGSNEAFLRFSDAESARHFSESVYKGQCSILEGDDETQYWHKIHKDRFSKEKKNRKRVRGREKLLKKAEKELGKHIKFDDTD